MTMPRGELIDFPAMVTFDTVARSFVRSAGIKLSCIQTTTWWPLATQHITRPFGGLKVIIVTLRGWASLVGFACALTNCGDHLVCGLTEPMLHSNFVPCFVQRSTSIQ
jgi:hypothetical protein